MSASGLPILTVTNLECIRNERLLFSGINFSLKAGDVLQVTGANGTGKSSLLQIITGLRSPTDGNLHWQQSKNFLYLGHKTAVKLPLTVKENLQSLQCLDNFFSSFYDDVLQQLQLHDCKNHLVHTLSAGQRQRLALARLWLLQAPLWILDEPFSHLDQAGIQIIEDRLQQHVLSGGGIILTSHQTLSLPHINLQQIIL